jgi:hypothetical protein
MYYDLMMVHLLCQMLLMLMLILFRMVHCKLPLFSLAQVVLGYASIALLVLTPLILLRLLLLHPGFHAFHLYVHLVDVPSGNLPFLPIVDSLT